MWGFNVIGSNEGLMCAALIPELKNLGLGFSRFCRYSSQLLKIQVLGVFDSFFFLF
uniref:Uncharacterized protein n=1 Tax=Rhizophora mucronata TaxID=61149 RepID=A0A2P2L2D9_RHIMU